MNLVKRIEEALEIYDNKFITLQRQDFIEFLQIVKLGQATQWIPVSERLPEDGQNVWITFINEAGKHTGDAIFRKVNFITLLIRLMAITKKFTLA